MLGKQNNLGEFEYLLLLGIVALKDQAYGVTIRQHFKTTIDRDVSIGAIYATCERLEKKHFIQSKKGEATAQRGGKAKRFYKVTVEGEAAINRSKAQMDAMWQSASSNLMLTI